jgi:NAD(P)H-flavin reductase
MGDVIKVCVPNYKPKSYSMSAEREGEFDITLKIYPNGRASGYLDRVEIGEEIQVFRKGNKQYNPGEYVCIIAYGVGITEAFPTAVAELEKSQVTKVVLMWALRKQDEEFWTNEMNEVAARFPDRFDLVRVFSREAVEGAQFGRINGEMINEVLAAKWWNKEEECGGSDEDHKSKVRFLSVGTKEMMKQTDDLLASLGYDIPGNILLF